MAQAGTAELRGRPVTVPICFATNVTWTELGSNLDVHGEGPATDRLASCYRFTEMECLLILD